MNNPEYFITDIMREVVALTAQLLIDDPKEVNFQDGFEINYQFGYVTELNQLMVNWSKLDAFAAKKYPLIWFRQPVTIIRDSPNYYGRIDNATLFIIQQTDKNIRAEERMETVFKPKIYPIYRKLFEAMNLVSDKITMEYFRPHNLVDRYYWGTGQAEEINDAVDCLEINSIKLIIENNQNC